MADERYIEAIRTWNLGVHASDGVHWAECVWRTGLLTFLAWFKG